MAISIDGYIAKPDGDSSWVSEVDTKIFENKIEEIGCIVVGRKTFEQYYGDLYPVKGVTNIVLTSSVTSHAKNEDVIFVPSPQKALQVAECKGYDKVLLIGGGHANGAFIQDNLVDEVFLSIHPLILGEGIKLFEDIRKQVDLDFISLKEMDAGLVQLHYKIKR